MKNKKHFAHFIFVLSLLFLLAGCGKSSNSSVTTAQPLQNSGEREITSNQKIAPVLTNYCASNDEVCYFLGGQKVTFSDGIVMVLGYSRFIYQSSSGDDDNDMDHNGVTLIASTTQQTPIYQMMFYGNNGSGYRPMYLYYDPQTDDVSMIFDLNNNGPSPDSDTVIDLTLTTIN